MSESLDSAAALHHDNSSIEAVEAARVPSSPVLGSTPQVWPNLLIIGAMKASSTLLYKLLSLHPEVWFPDSKEPNFFISPDVNEPAAWEKYQRLFRQSPPGAKLVGDASVSNSCAPVRGPVPARIRDRLGRPKLVYILRDPVDRMVSHYRHRMSRPGNFPGDMSMEEMFGRFPVIIHASRYAYQIELYEAEFGPGSVHLMIAEELHRDPVRVLADLAAYLEIEETPAWREPLPQVNDGNRMRERIWTWDLYKRIPAAKRLAGSVPRPCKEIVRRVVLKFAKLPPPAPPITEAMRRKGLELVADDLRVLRERLGARIDIWPSVQKLGL